MITKISKVTIELPSGGTFSIDLISPDLKSGKATENRTNKENKIENNPKDIIINEFRYQYFSDTGYLEYLSQL
jgi:hypothetical protein